MLIDEVMPEYDAIRTEHLIVENCASSLAALDRPDRLSRDQMSPETVHKIRVRYNECDQVGIVFNANYLVYTDIVATEFFREHIGGYAVLTDLGLDFALAEANIRFRRPLHNDEEFEVKASVNSITSRSLSMEFEFTREGEQIAEIAISYVCIDKETQVPHVIPDRISEILEG